MEKYYFLNADNEFDYYVTVKQKENEDVVYTLYRVHNNTKVIRITDNGNGFKITNYDCGVLDGHVDYHEIEYMKLLLQFIDKVDENLSEKYRLIKESDIIDLT